MSIEENKAIVRRYVEELWTAGDIDVADEIIHPNTRGRWASFNGPEGQKQSIPKWTVSEDKGCIC